MSRGVLPELISEVEALADRVVIIRKGRIAEEISPAQLAGISIRKIKVRFLDEVDFNRFAKLDGVRIISRGNGQEVTLQVEGQMDKLIKQLAEYRVSNFETINTSLEEVFLEYYEGGEEGRDPDVG